MSHGHESQARGLVKRGMIITYGVLAAIIGVVAVYVVFVPSKYERDEQRWEEMERARELRQMRLTGETAEEEEYRQRVALAEQRFESADSGAMDMSHRPSDVGSMPRQARNRQIIRRPGKPVLERWRVGGPSPRTQDRHLRQQPARINKRTSFVGVPVTMYMLPTCPVCIRARSWLREKGFKLTERDVSSDRRAVVAYNRIVPGRRKPVPVFQIGGRIIVGFKKDAIIDAVR